MAGLRETCSHVVALLFTAEANSPFKQQTSSPSLLCVWFQYGDLFIRVGEMDFIIPGMKRKLAARQRNSLNDDDDIDTSTKRELQKILKPTESEITNFYSQLTKTSGKPAILSDYSNVYMPASQLSDYPKPLTDLYDPSAETLSFDDLTIKCKEI